MNTIKDILSNVTTTTATTTTTTTTTTNTGNTTSSSSNSEPSTPNVNRSNSFSDDNENNNNNNNDNENKHNDIDEDDQDHLLPMQPPQYPSYSPPESPNSRQWEHKRWELSWERLYALIYAEVTGPPPALEASSDAASAATSVRSLLAVPLRLHSFLRLGLTVCLDAYLHALILIPFRAMLAAIRLLIGIIIYIATFGQERTIKVKGNKLKVRGFSLFCRTHAHDLLLFFVVILGTYALKLLNMGRVYHYIRGQTMIKLYVLTAMMEIFDKLLCSFGQDAFGFLFWQTHSDPYAIGTLFFAFLITLLYVILHSGMYFIHVATLTVAINSQEQSLIPLLLLNNFAEIKSFVFKKFDRQNLFQLACSDVTEHFRLVLFFFCIMIVALAQEGRDYHKILPTYLLVIIMMLAGEGVADSIKHAFIGKFNNISASVYNDFTRVLRKDIVRSQKDKVIVDRTHMITRRVGLAQIPLVCVSIRYFILAFSSQSVQGYIASCSNTSFIIQIIIVFLFLIICKTLLGIGLVIYAGSEHNKELDARNVSVQRTPDRTGSVTQLLNIERYTAYKGRVVG